MSKNLKINYEKKLLDEHKEFIVRKILKENFDKETANKAVQLIKQLNSIKWPDELHSFKSGTAKAIAELKKVLAGQGRDKNLFDKIVGLFKSNKENPFVDVFAYTSALTSFFTIMQKLADALKDESKENLTIGNIVADGDIMKEEQFKAIVKKGLKPEGAMANIKTNWFQKYLQGNSDAIAEEISNLDPEVLNDFSKQLNDTLKGSKEVINQIAQADKEISQSLDIKQNKETEPTKNAEPTEPTKSTTATTPNEVVPGKQSSSEKSPASEPAVEEPKSAVEKAQETDRQNIINNAGKKIAPELAKLGIKKNIVDIVSAFYDAGLLK